MEWFSLSRKWYRNDRDDFSHFDRAKDERRACLPEAGNRIKRISVNLAICAISPSVEMTRDKFVKPFDRCHAERSRSTQGDM